MRGCERTEGKSWCYRLAFSLRTMMLLVLVVAAGLGWKVNRAHAQRRAVALIGTVPGDVLYDYQFDGNYPYKQNKSPQGPIWLRKALGDEYFQEVTEVGFYSDVVTDERLAAIKELDRLLSVRLVHAKRVTDSGLASLSRLRNLRILLLSDMQITDAGLAQLSGLKGLREITIVDCPNVSDAGLSSLAGLQKLKVSGCPGVTNAGMSRLSGLKNLLEIDVLSCPGMTDAGLARLSSLAGLREINLSNCLGVTDVGLARLAAMPSLEVLDLSLNGDRVTDASLALLKNIKSLHILNLNDTEVTDAGLAHLSALTGLQKLDVSKTQITDAGLMHINGLSQLRKLNLQETGVSAAGIAAITRSVPGLAVTRDGPFTLLRGLFGN